MDYLPPKTTRNRQCGRAGAGPTFVAGNFAEANARKEKERRIEAEAGTGKKAEDAKEEGTGRLDEE